MKNYFDAAVGNKVVQQVSLPGSVAISWRRKETPCGNLKTLLISDSNSNWRFRLKRIH